MTTQNFKLKDTYNRVAAGYALEHPEISDQLKQTLDAFITFLGNRKQILDLGCGTGRDAKYYIDNGLEVTGFDFSESMIKIAQESVPLGTFKVTDMLTDEFGVEVYDGIAANASLLHIPKVSIGNVLYKLIEL